MLFRRIFLCALLVGTCSGLIHSAVQRWQVIPLIAAAETFEAASPHRHVHEAIEWAPQDGVERIAWTVVANILGATGFALLLLPLMAFWDRLGGGQSSSWRSGLLWGAAAWLCTFALPAIGLPPELPGTAAAALHSRQTWWLLTALCAASSLTLIFLARRTPGTWRWLGAALLALPFVIGAPSEYGNPSAVLEGNAAAQMTTLSARFVFATAVATALHWLVLGALSGTVVAHWLRPLLAASPRQTLDFADTGGTFDFTDTGGHLTSAGDGSLTALRPAA
jgi:cobalt transporter subunit CbtA